MKSYEENMNCILVFCRYTVISGTPEKILEHFLETMRMDIHPSEPGSTIIAI